MRSSAAPHLRIAAAALAVIAGAAAAQDTPQDPVELESITVIAPQRPLDRSLELLRILVEQSTPCLGCDAVLRQPRSRTASLLGYLLLPGEPPQVDEATRLAHEIKLQDSPDLDYLRP